MEGVEATGRLATAAEAGVAAQVAGLAEARAVGVAAVSAAVAFARGRGTATLPLPTEDEDRRKGGVFGSCDGGGAAAALSGPRTKPDTALPRASRPGPAADQSCCI